MWSDKSAPSCATPAVCLSFCTDLQLAHSCTQAPTMRSAASATTLCQTPAPTRMAARAARCSVAGAGQPAAPPARAAPPAVPRRLLLAGAAAAAAALVPAQSAQAFGSGFPGYDVNMDARKRAAERNQREIDAMMERGELPRRRAAALQQQGCTCPCCSLLAMLTSPSPPMSQPRPCLSPPLPPCPLPHECPSPCSRGVQGKTGGREGGGGGGSTQTRSSRRATSSCAGGASKRPVEELPGQAAELRPRFARLAQVEPTALAPAAVWAGIAPRARAGGSEKNNCLQRGI